MSFPELEDSTVFLACPSDVAYLVDIVSAELALLRQQVADDQGLKLFSWFDRTEEDDLPGSRRLWLDARFAAQSQIPPPIGPKCRAVLCLFGERIGTPLPATFSLGAIESLNATDPTKDSWLALDWKPEHAERGGFPLTGTTFEYLSAFAEKKIPIFLGFVGDESILDPPPILTQANWGCRRLRKEIRNRFEDDDEAWESWIAKNRRELRQLHNFLRYVRRGGIQPQLLGDAEKARPQIREFLIRALRLRVAETDRDPFKGLEVYDVEDSSVFFGRSIERAEAIDRFLERWDDAEKPTAFAIVGGSGVGKSSFLRAGILGRLRNDPSRGSFIDCVVRPGELLAGEALKEAPDANGAPFELALLKLFERALEEVRAAWTREGKDPAELAVLAAKAAELAMVLPAQRPAWTVMQLSEALHRLGPAFKMVLGFDQFEEILDQRNDPVAGPFWRPVVDLIDLAVRSERIGILYTLQANRVGLIADDPTLSPIWALDGQKNLGFPEQAIREIIRRPFEITGKIEIAPDLVEALSDRITTFKNKESGAVQGSLLPLISLTLRRIYEKRALPLLEDLRSRERKKTAAAPGFAHAARDTDASRSPATDSATVTLTVESCADLLNVEDAIAELAEEAMKEAREASGPDWSDTTLGDLFRRLVEVRGHGYGLPDSTIPSAAAPRRLAEALRRRRLLLPADRGRVRLVHEAVLSHWTPAREWLDSESSLLRHVARLEQMAREWDAKKDRSREYVEGFGLNDVDQAARVLAQWYDVLLDPVVLADSRDKRLLREFSLELLQAHPTPSRIVEELSRKPTHLIVAAYYDRTDLVRSYLEKEPESVHLARTDRRTAIFGPCFTGSIEILDLLLARGATVDEPDEKGWRPVHAAATAGQVACLARLREMGAALEPAGAPEETSLLHLAARNGHVEMLRYLLGECGLAPSVVDARRWTPLHFAASFDQPPAIRVLVEAGADREARIDEGWTPLHLAAKGGHPAAVSALLEAQADPGPRLYNDWTPLHLASRGNHGAIARQLLQRGADPRSRAVNDWPGVWRMKKLREERQKAPRGERGKTFDWESLHVAADQSCADVIRVLLDGGADPNALTGGSEAALHLAVQKGHRAVLPPLLAHGKADPEIRNGDDETPFHVALRGEQWQLATDLVRLGADVDAFLIDSGTKATDRRTALHEAAWNGEVQRATFLVELGADPNAETGEGRTPLHLAAARGAEALVDLLLTQGAKPETKAGDGTTAFHLACLGGHPGVARRLAALLSAIDLNAEGEVTPLHLAARRGSPEVVELLLERNHPANCADRHGWTPLHLAAQQGSLAVVHLLLAAGADGDAVAKKPAMTPLQAAAELGHTEIVDALLRAGADSAIETAGRGRAIALAAKHGHEATVRRLLEHGDSLGEAVVGTSLLIPDSSFPPSQGTGDIFSYPWTAVPAGEIERLVEQINPVDGRYHLGAKTASADRCGLPWYDGVDLYRLRDPSLPENFFLCYLRSHTGDLIRLDGTSPPIHVVNAKAPIRLTPEHVLDYLRFFCFFVHGEEGPFYVAEHPDDPLLPSDPLIHKVLAETIRPARLEGLNKQGFYQCSATVYYSDALFAADFAVHPGGMVEMLEDEPVAASLKSKIEARLS